MIKGNINQGQENTVSMKEGILSVLFHCLGSTQQVFNKHLLNEGLQETSMVLISSSYYYHLGMAKHPLPTGFWSLVVTIFYGSMGLLAVPLGLWVSTPLLSRAFTV